MLTGDLASLYEVKSVSERYGLKSGNVFVYCPDEVLCCCSVTEEVIHSECSFSALFTREYVACCCTVNGSCELCCVVSCLTYLKNGKLCVFADHIDKIKVVAFFCIVAVADVVNYLTALRYGIKDVVLDILEINGGCTCEHLHEAMSDSTVAACEVCAAVVACLLQCYVGFPRLIECTLNVCCVNILFAVGNRNCKSFFCIDELSGLGL